MDRHEILYKHYTICPHNQGEYWHCTMVYTAGLVLLYMLAWHHFKEDMKQLANLYLVSNKLINQ